MSSFRAADNELSNELSNEPSREPSRDGLSRRAFAAAALAGTAIPLAVAVAGPASAAPAASGRGAAPAKKAPKPPKPPKVPPTPDFGPNVQIFDPSTPTATIQAAVDAAAAQQVPAEFGTGRFAFLFKPGSYDVDIQLGYYTSVAGLGLSPDDVTINGEVRVEGQQQSDGTFSGLTNFWRSVENLAIVPTDGINWFAVSQAAPIRRVHVKGQLFLFPRQGGFTSGGFIADTAVDGQVINASQQQWLTRDSQVGSWSNAVWNQVFAGVIGAPDQSFPNPPYTTLPTSPKSREKPFLAVDAKGRWQVVAPRLRHNALGTTWNGGAPTAARTIAIDDFFIARPGDSAHTINKALDNGKHLLFTPGIYTVDQTIRVKRAGTVVLGIGYPTISPVRGVVPMTVASTKGVQLAGLLFDAGEANSPLLLQVGDKRGGWSDSGDPTSVQDVFFRIGGAGPGKATVALEVNADNVLLDHIWAWRADHGSGVGWTVNTAEHGVIVNGDHVQATGLFVEHFQKYNVVWNGDHGSTIMFQNELPYDPPNQAAYQHKGTLGWAAYKVDDYVKHHEGWGLGSYCFFNVDPTIHVSHSFEVPVTKGVVLHDLLTVSLNGDGVIDNVVNDFGGPAQGTDTVPVNVVLYPPATS